MNDGQSTMEQEEAEIETYHLSWMVGRLFGLVCLFNGISTFVGYLMPEPPF